ncbi:MAG: M3 family metallopeptidase [Gammaproteobacteria bacterium]|nr:M3 family metallopeptidase [Gammaproteobacteria bacterium]
MLDKWTGPFGGVPAWDKVKVSEFEAAFQAAITENRAELKAIADNTAAPDFDNTIAALEKAGGALNRFYTYFGIHSSTLNVGDMPKIESALAPKQAAYGDEVTQNAKLFARIEAVYNAPEKAKLTPEQQRLTWLYYTNFVRSGAKLDAKQKARLSELNQRLASLYTSFGQNVLFDEQNGYTVLDEASMKGLPADIKDAAQRAAEAKKLKGKYLIANTRSAADPFLTLSEDRAAREKVWRAFIGRGDMGGEHDNNKLITEILELRYERAQLLGYKSHAHWRLEQEMAQTPERAVALMEAVWKPGAAAVARDVAEMQKLIDAEGGKYKLAAWDYRYISEKLRKAKYDLDMTEVSNYLQLDRLREGMFWMAAKLYDLHFSQLSNVAVYHPDVTVYEVKNGKGQHVGLWYFDPYARDGKRSGAWMNAYRNQERFNGEITTIVSNNANFVKGKDGAPVLISWDDAETLFHEFGHALHGLLSDVNYPTLSGTSVSRDFVEFPSQIHEHWLATPEVLNKFALHYQTGKPIPAALVDKIEKAATFNEGFRTMEYLGSAVIDMKLHLAGAGPIDPDKFEREELKKLGMPEEIVMRHRTPQFNHVFSGDGYSAGYYAYLWADSLTADVWEAFEEGKGAWDENVALRFRKNILSVGNTVDQAQAFRNFRGRDVDTQALMRKRGFVEAEKTAGQ